MPRPVLTRIVNNVRKFFLEMLENVKRYKMLENVKKMLKTIINM